MLRDNGVMRGAFRGALGLRGKAPIIIESFETLTPATGPFPTGVTQMPGSDANDSAPQSTSNVTEGTYSLLLDNSVTAVSGCAGQIVLGTAPPSATKVKVDYTCTVDGGDVYTAMLYDPGNVQLDGVSATGSGTLTIDAIDDQTILVFAYIGSKVYFDNLRYTDNGGTLIALINSFETYPVYDVLPNTVINTGLDDLSENTTWYTHRGASQHIQATVAGVYIFGPYDLSPYAVISFDYANFSAGDAGDGLSLQVTNDAIDTIYGVGGLAYGDAASGTVNIYLDNSFDMSAAYFYLTVSDAELDMDNIRVVEPFTDTFYAPSMVADANLVMGGLTDAAPAVGVTMVNGTTILAAGADSRIVPETFTGNLDIELWGGGANGGGRTSNGGGGGGESGAYSKYDNYAASIGQKIEFTIAAQPAAGGTGNGADGNDSSVTTPAMTALGGDGGDGGSSNTGGTGEATASGGTTNTNGASGNTGDGSTGAKGGDAPSGGGTGGASRGTQGAGNNGNAPGGAGAGAFRSSSNQNGGRGTTGGIKFSW